MAALVLAPGLVAGQNALALKRDTPATDNSPCRTSAAADEPAPTASQKQEAARLAASATQASILGDHRSARDLLVRATRLDPTTENLAYRLARTYQELGQTAEAVSEYCRYLALAPKAPDADDVRQRITELAPAPPPTPYPAGAIAAFRDGLSAFDAGRYYAAGTSFSAVITAAPTWADAYFNRALSFERQGLRDRAATDLRQYLTLEPDAPDRASVQSTLLALAARPTTQLSPGVALAAGLVIPGAGEFYARRPALGLLYLAAAGGAAAFGVLYQRKNVDCLSSPQNGICPPDQVLNTHTEKPYLTAGVGAAVGITVLGAITAFGAAKHRNEGSNGAAASSRSPGSGPSLDPPSLAPAPGGGVRVQLLSFRF